MHPHNHHVCPDCGAPVESSDALCRCCLVSQIINPRDVDEIEFDLPLGEIGDYEILEKIAQGGMGIVYRARQKSLGRIVAIKLIPEGRLASFGEVQRFHMEAEAAAKLDHPNIISVHEIGEENGQHFYSMRLVNGGSLSEHVGDFKKEARKVAEILIKIARAVHFAHTHGILHRDLKPANILVDDDGEPQIMDFGLAKRLDTNEPNLTMTGQVMGSPAYMAPELLTGTGSASTLSEVYSLGIILYQLLAGHVPFGGTSQLAIIRLVADSEPDRLTGIDRDLATICLKSIEKEPTRRYESAEHFAADLERWLEGKLILARPASVSLRAVKWIRRKPALAALFSVSILAAVGSWVILLESNVRVTEERNRAIQSERDTRMQLYVSDMAAVMRALDAGNLFQAREILQRHLPGEGMEDLREFEWRHFWLKCQGDEDLSIPCSEIRAIQSITFSPDSKTFAFGGNGFAIFGDMETREVTTTLPDDQHLNLLLSVRREFSHAQEAISGERRKERALTAVTSMAYLDDNRVILGGGEDNASLWDLSIPRNEDWINIDRACLLNIPDSNLLVVGHGWVEFGTKGEGMQLYDRTTMEPLAVEFPGAGGLVDVSADGQWFVTGDSQGYVKVFGRDGSLRASHFFKAPITSVSISANGKIAAATVQPQAAVQLIDIEANIVHRLEGHRARAWSVDFSPDGSLLASTGSDQTICLWDVSSRTQVRRLLGHTAEVKVVRFSPDGRWLLSGGLDHQLKFWDLEKMKSLNSFPDLSSPIRFSPDGQTFASVGQDGCIRLLDSAFNETARLPLLQQTHAIRFRPETDEFFAMVEESGGFQPWTIRRWSTKTFEELPALATIKNTSGVSYFHGDIAPDCEQVTAACNRIDGIKVQIFGADSGNKMEEFQYFHRSCATTMVEYDEWDGGLWFCLWPNTILKKFGEHTESVITPPAAVKSFAISEKYVAAGLEDGRICIYDRRSYSLEMTLVGHLDDLSGMAFNPDGTRLASSSGDGTLRLWNLRAHREIAILAEDKQWRDMAFSADGKNLVATVWNGGMWVWQAPDLDEIDVKSALFR
jgi:serine/threonine protein kinase/WD40 repeat protein